MALALGKLTIIVGAGLIGSVLAKEGRLPSVSDLVSGAFKFRFKNLRNDNSTSSNSKPMTGTTIQTVCVSWRSGFYLAPIGCSMRGLGRDAVDSLRQELLLFASNRSVTIVTGSQSGSGKYGVIVIVVGIGYGYIWWKGWKLSDMMFATRRGLNDACSSVAKQLETVYSSVAATKKHLSLRIDGVDCKIDECMDNTTATREEVSEVRADVKLIGADVQSVHQVVQSLETKILRIEGRQNETNYGVGKLVTFVRNLENRSTEQIEGATPVSSRPALELPQATPSRTLSLPTDSSAEPPSPSTSNGYQKRQTSLPPSSSHSKVAGSGLKDLYGISDDVGSTSQRSPRLSTQACGETNSESSTAGIFGRKLSGISASLLTREVCNLSQWNSIRSNISPEGRVQGLGNIS